MCASMSTNIAKHTPVYTFDMATLYTHIGYYYYYVMDRGISGIVIVVRTEVLVQGAKCHSATHDVIHVSITQHTHHA